MSLCRTEGLYGGEPPGERSFFWRCKVSDKEKEKSIVRVKHDPDHPYVVIARTMAQDSSLSLRARGLLLYLLSLPDDWKVYISHLAKVNQEGRHSITMAMNELIEAGYCSKEKFKDEHGRYAGWKYTIYENKRLPKAENRKSEIPKSEILKSENRKLQSSNSNKVEIETKKDKQSTEEIDSADAESSPHDSKQKSNQETKDDIETERKIHEIVSYLNEKTGKHFPGTRKVTKRHIRARLREKHTLDDFKRVIDYKADQWLRDPKMNEYLRPETLFNTKFESYLQAAPSRESEYRTCKHGHRYRKDIGYCPVCLELDLV